MLWRIRPEKLLGGSGGGLLANAPNVVFGASEPPVSVSYQTNPVLPGVAAEACGGQAKRPVGDPGVDVHAAVVLARVYKVVHGGRLRILAEHVVVVGGPGASWNARPSPEPVREQALADQPAGLRRRLLPDVLLDERPEDIGHRFVQRAGLVR